MLLKEKEQADMKNGRSKFNTVMGYIIFFLTVSVTVALALVVYELLERSENGQKGIITLAMLAVIISVSFLFTVIDAFRRKIMVSRPTQRILDATERIAGGDFSVRLEPKHSFGKYDEYDLIMENLNMVAEELGKNAVLKTDFISNVSHELKTPIAVIKNSAEMLESRINDGEEKKYIANISAAAKNLSELVNNVLKLQKLENGSLFEEYQGFSCDELLTECIVLFTDKIDGKDIELILNIEEFRVRSIASHLEIIFNNLISNAVKFTPNGGKITISLVKQDKDAVFKVSDTGMGISAEDGAHIFDKFYQADSSHSKEGTGLGLPLVKRVVDILGGEISVESEIGAGTAFSVRLKSCAE